MLNYFVTVFTPTYNRADLLVHLYNSLLRQSNTNFEWLIVDDGSIDNTRDVVRGFIDEGKITIKYFYQLNGGKHRAINNGILQANGSYFFIVDSDDQLVDCAIDFIYTYGSEILDDKSYAGLIGVKSLFSGKTLIKSNVDQLDASYIDITYKHKMFGDKAEVFKTTILKDYLFPDITGELFCSESLVWNRIAREYKMRFINKVIYLCDYLAGGLSYNSLSLRMENPQYAMLTYLESIDLNIPILFKVKSILNFWRFYYHNKYKYKKCDLNFDLPYVAYFLKPFAYVIFTIDKKNK